MAPESTCAVVITYHPDDAVLENLATLRPQIQHLVVVDNGSSPAELALLRAASIAVPFELIENSTNLGIATALNQGIRRALEIGAPWIVLFDQDSRVTPGFIQTLLDSFIASPHGDRLGLLVPSYTDMRHGGTLAPERLPSGTLAVAITSGSLLRASTFLQHGLFLDDLFIDGVDHEFCLRLRRAGLLIDDCPAAVLLHSPGTPRHHQLPGGKAYTSTNYSPLRRYYQARNNLWIAFYYLRDFPGFSLRLLATTAKDVLKILLAEDNKRRKLVATLHGIVDALRGRMGKREPS